MLQIKNIKANEITKYFLIRCRLVYPGIVWMYIAASQKETGMSDSIVKVQDNPVIETIMARRSIRKYKPEAVERDKMETILNCGIHAPNGMNKQSWEVRVVDNQDFINEPTEIFKKENPKAAERAGFKNMFNNAPTVAFIAYDPRYDMSQMIVGF